MVQQEPIIFDRYTERNLTGGFIVFDNSHERTVHLRFNHLAARMMNLTEDHYVQFLKIGDDWFVTKTRLKRGYKLSKSGSGYRVNSTLFVREFLAEKPYPCTVLSCKII